MDLESKPLEGPIESEEQAKNWVISQVTNVEHLRQVCDFALTRKDQIEAYHWWMFHRGVAFGSLQALKRMRRLSDQTYGELKSKLKSTGVPTVSIHF